MDNDSAICNAFRDIIDPIPLEGERITVHSSRAPLHKCHAIFGQEECSYSNIQMSMFLS